MDFYNSFERFWKRKGETLHIKNPARTYDNLHRKMKDFHTVKDIDDYVCMLRTSKESTRQIMVKFFDYLKKEEHVPLERSGLYDMRFYDKFERRLEIAKFLYKPKTRKELLEEFSIAGRTLDDDLQALEQGMEMLGSNIQIQRIEDEQNRIRYKSSVHPVFLPLNLTEVYAMTRYLPSIIDRRDPNSQIIFDITNRIKAQLSDDVADRLLHGDKGRGTSIDYLDDESLARQRKGVLMYLMKSGQECCFIWNGKEYRGRIRDDNGHYWIQLSDGSKLEGADPKEVDFIIDSFEYK